MSDRVNERRRAAQLARHYRDQEHLTITEIARRLGRAEATVKAYLYATIRPARKRARSRPATRASAAAAARRPRRAAVRARPTRFASAAIPARSRQPGRASGCATPCAPGERCTGVRRPRRTGLARTRGGAVARRPNAGATGTGRRPRRSSTCTAPGRRRGPTPSLTTEPKRKGGLRGPARYPAGKDGRAPRQPRRTT
jgi:hypothetical protein